MPAASHPALLGTGQIGQVDLDLAGALAALAPLDVEVLGVDDVDEVVGVDLRQCTDREADWLLTRPMNADPTDPNPF